MFGEASFFLREATGLVREISWVSLLFYGMNVLGFAPDPVQRFSRCMRWRFTIRKPDAYDTCIASSYSKEQRFRIENQLKMIKVKPLSSSLV